MTLSIQRLALIAGLAITAAGCARLDRESSTGAYCAYAGGRESYENCGYSSLQQCLATVRGVGGSCRPNPRGGYAGPPARQRRTLRAVRE